jgi:hypothetical protein
MPPRQVDLPEEDVVRLQANIESAKAADMIYSPHMDTVRHCPT